MGSQELVGTPTEVAYKPFPQAGKMSGLPYVVNISSWAGFFCLCLRPCSLRLIRDHSMHIWAARSPLPTALGSLWDKENIEKHRSLFSVGHLPWSAGDLWVAGRHFSGLLIGVHKA